jgi:hypothetical protein
VYAYVWLTARAMVTVASLAVTVRPSHAHSLPCATPTSGGSAALGIFLPMYSTLPSGRRLYDMTVKCLFWTRRRGGSESEGGSEERVRTGTCTERAGLWTNVRSWVIRWMGWRWGIRSAMGGYMSPAG